MPYAITDGANDKMCYTNGDASDGGLSIKVTENNVYAFPIGSNSKYTPVALTVSNYSDDGYVTIRPVDAELATTNLSGGNLLHYYWRVGHNDFTTLPMVQYNFRYDDTGIGSSVGG